MELLDEAGTKELELVERVTLELEEEEITEECVLEETMGEIGDDVDTDRNAVVIVELET